MEKITNILHYILFAFILLLMAVFVTLQMPAVQTYTVNRAISALEGVFDADVNLGEIHFKPFNTILLKDLEVIDRAPVNEEARDTLLKAGTLSVRFSLNSLIGPGHDDIILKEVILKHAQFNFVIEDGEYPCNLVRMFKLLPPEEPEPMPEKDILLIRNLTVEDLSYSMQNFTTEPMDVPATAINWMDMGVDGIDLKARNFSISHGLFSATADHLDFKERTGWDVKEIKGSVVAGKGLVDIRDLVIDDGISHAEMDFRMKGTSADYADFVNKVVLEADIYSSVWSLEALAHFIPPLNPDRSTCVFLRGKARGPVADIRGDGLRLDFKDRKVGFTLDGGVKNLPDVDNMEFDANISSLNLTMPDVCKVVNAIAPGARLDLGDIGKGQVYSGSILVKGPINRMDASLDLTQGTDGGHVALSAIVSDVLKQGRPPISVKGRIVTDGLDIGTLLGSSPELGPASLRAKAELRLPEEEGVISARLDSLNISRMRFKGHDYGNIRGNVSMQGKDLTADVSSDDPSLDADVTVWSDKYAYNGAVLVRKADLMAMNIDKRGVSEVGMNIYGHLDKDLGKLQGNARISDIRLTNAEGLFEVPDIALDVANANGLYDIDLDSDVARGHFNGNGKNFEGWFESLATSSLLSFVMPGVYMEQGSRAEMSIDAEGMVCGSISSGRIAYYNNFIKDLDARIYGCTSDIRADVSSSKIRIADFEMDRNLLKAGLTDSTVTLAYTFDNEGTEAADDLLNGEFNAGIRLGGTGRMGLDIRPSRINMGSREWTIPQASIEVNGRNIKVDGFSLTSGNQWIKIDGRTSDTETATLKADIHNLDLSPVNRFIEEDLSLTGLLNASAVLVSPLGEGLPEIEMMADLEKLTVSGTELGNISATSVYDAHEDRFNISVNERMGLKTPLNAEAVYRPSDKTIDGIAYLDRMPIGFAQGLLKDVFSRMNGTVSGKVLLNGPVSRPEIRSDDGRIEDALLEIAFTHVPYRLEGAFFMDNDGIHLKDVAVADRKNGKGTASGGLKWNHFKDMELDLHMDVTDMEAIDMPVAEPGGVFYGNMDASGLVSVTGPFNDVTLGVDARTAGKGSLHLVISGSMDAAGGNGLLTFTGPKGVAADPYAEILKRYEKETAGDGSNFKIRIKAVADPDLNVSMDLGSGGFAAGLSGRGNGTVDLAVDTAPSSFNILGDYTLTDGNFNVNASNIVHRAFSISNGSSIKFGGDVMESTVNLDAIYQTKASIATLIADTSSVSNRRVVNCGIHIQDKLSEPQVNFSINIPDLEPSVKSRVESALSTEDKVQKQFLSLLLSNNFLPDEQSGIVNNSSLLYSNVSEMMASQVNNIFTKLDIPLDLGLNYQPSETGGTNLFDVALSTQLFNNRVIIGGTLGNRQKMTSSTETLFGDLDIQYKVTRSGALRLSLFSHSVDQYTNALDNAQRNGVGVTWQQEFDRLPQWFKKLFSNKEQREMMAALEAEEQKETKRIILDE